MIFLNLLNRIFGPKKPLSRQEIDDYKSESGNSHDIESKAAGSDFNDKALEGWKTTSSTVADGMSGLDQKMEQFINNDSAKSSSKNGMALSFILFTLAMLTLIIFTYQGNSAIEKKPMIIEEAKEENSRSEEIDFYTVIPTEKQITPNELIKNREVKKVDKKTSEISNSKINKSQIKTKKVEEKEVEIELPIQSTGKIPNATKSTLVYKDAKEVYLSDLKNVDYRAYRNRPIKVMNLPEIGIPASQSSEEDKQEFSSVQMKEITYIDYLITSSGYFSRGEFKTALKHYLTILDTYPDDVNANFYGGLCYFNLGRFDQSTLLLSKSYSLGYGNFREEAKWFTARAQIEENNMLKAKNLLEEIVNEGGFYKEQAAEVLGELEE